MARRTGHTLVLFWHWRFWPRARPYYMHSEAIMRPDVLMVFCTSHEYGEFIREANSGMMVVAQHL